MPADPLSELWGWSGAGAAVHVHLTPTCGNDRVGRRGLSQCAWIGTGAQGLRGSPLTATGRYDDLDLALLDRDNEDERRFLIEAEHPELHEALRNDVDELHVNGLTTNPRLHIALHELVANQLWADDPPEAWETAQRLTAAGYDRHEVLHMLASVNADQIYSIMRDRTPADLDRMRAALADLPESWERDRETPSHDRRLNRAERRAAARRRR